MKKIIDKLIKKNQTISTMESCTGGGLVNALTNVEGASSVIKFSTVTYSNEFKIKMGVSQDVIDTYSVYSMETAREMSKNISNFTNSDFSVGITGKLNRFDKNNLYGEDNAVFICIYDRNNDKYYDYKINVYESTRKENKQLVIDLVKEKLEEII